MKDMDDGEGLRQYQFAVRQAEAASERAKACDFGSASTYYYWLKAIFWALMVLAAK